MATSPVPSPRSSPFGRKENALPLSDEILVTRTFLDDKQGQLNEFEPLGAS